MATTLSPATLAQLVTRARERADLVNSGFIATGAGSEEEVYVQQSAQALHAILVECDPDRYVVTAALTSPDTLAPFDDWTLPTDFGWLRKVTYTESGNTRVLRRLTLDEFVAYTASGTSGSPVGWFLQRSLLRLAPGPGTATPQPTIYYIPGQVALTAGPPAVNFDGVDGWDEWITLDVAVKMLHKEETPALHLEAERARVEARVRSQATSRSVGDPPKATDTENPWSYGWPPPLPPP